MMPPGHHLILSDEVEGFRQYLKNKIGKFAVLQPLKTKKLHYFSFLLFLINLIVVRFSGLVSFAFSWFLRVSKAGSIRVSIGV